MTKAFYKTVQLDLYGFYGRYEKLLGKRSVKRTTVSATIAIGKLQRSALIMGKIVQYIVQWFFKFSSHNILCESVRLFSFPKLHFLGFFQNTVQYQKSKRSCKGQGSELRFSWSWCQNRVRNVVKNKLTAAPLKYKGTT